ncbi:MAG TPA: hypothetical protein VMV10_13800 [Pirellulales bacterium]|nr:hypothetical protein [Pirellulales bacterium]
MILLTGACLWFGWKVDRARKQQDAIRAVRAMGGDVHYDCQERPIAKGSAIRFPNLFDSLDNKPPSMAKSLRRMLGDDFYFYRSVVAVRLSGRDVGNRDLQILKQLPDLHSVLLRNTAADVEELRASLPGCRIYDSSKPGAGRSATRLFLNN